MAEAADPGAERLVRHIERCRAEAEKIVGRIQENNVLLDDPHDLTDQVQARLALAAHHDLLQALAQLQLEADLFVRHSSEATETDAAAREKLAASLARIHETVSQMNAIVRTYLDPAETNRLLIRLDLVPVDLTMLIERHLRAGHLLDHAAVSTTLEEARIDGDADRLMTVFDHLFGRFMQRRGRDQQVEVSVRSSDDHAEIYLGLAPWPGGSVELIGELSAPLRLESMDVDVPYARAVVERHGGRFLVGRTETDGAGFRLVFPSLRTARDAEVAR